MHLIKGPLHDYIMENFDRKDDEKKPSTQQDMNPWHPESPNTK